MKDRGWIEPIVERVVGQVLDSHVAQLRSEIVGRVSEEMKAALPASASGSGANSADLARAVGEVQQGTSQREVLRALLDACGRYATRVALFVVKGSQAIGWQARGFEKSDGIKDFNLDVRASAISRAIERRAAVNAKAAEIDARLLKEFGSPRSGEARVLPLVLKDKVAALVYADAGTDSNGTLDAGSIELLVFTTSAWLEVTSLRKQPQAAGGAGEGPRPAAADVSPAFNDPFAGHVPSHARAAAAAAESFAPAASAAPQSPAAATKPSGMKSKPAVAEADPATSAGDSDIQRKAQRFARLLVDEIKLYNQAKVAEGRKHKDLYDRLKEAIEKSRVTYQKRYGSTVAGSAKCFEDELIRSLAEDDVSIMGANFRR